jgi:RelE toxin of RelE / RelB toxin-antitoxin system
MRMILPILRQCRSIGSMHTVVETPPYLADAERLFTPDEREAIVDLVASDPRCGVVVANAAGIRKVRFGFGGRGKTGGARVIYLFGGDDVPVFLLAAFAKNEKADLAPKERAAIAKTVTTMLADYRRKR